MKDLLVVELNRLRWRRAVVLLAGVAVVLPLFIFTVTAWNTRPVSDAERQQARVQMERDSGGVDMERDLDQCVAAPRSVRPARRGDR